MIEGLWCWNVTKRRGVGGIGREKNEMNEWQNALLSVRQELLWKFFASNFSYTHTSVITVGPQTFSMQIKWEGKPKDDLHRKWP